MVYFRQLVAKSWEGPGLGKDVWDAVKGKIGRGLKNDTHRSIQNVMNFFRPRVNLSSSLQMKNIVLSSTSFKI